MASHPSAESCQRFYFMLNDKELAEISRIKATQISLCGGLLWLGCFNANRSLLNPEIFKSIQRLFIARFHYRDPTLQAFKT